MTYILIIMWHVYGASHTGRTAISVEFNDKQSCQIAAAEIRRQSGDEIKTILCAPKGKSNG